MTKGAIRSITIRSLYTDYSASGIVQNLHHFTYIFRHRCLQRIFLNRGSIWQILRQIVQEWQEKMERRIQRRCCSLLQALSRNEDWKRDYKNATVCFTSFPYHIGSVKYEQHINTYLIRKRTLSYFWNWLQFWNFSSHCKYFCSPLIRALSEGKQQLMKLQPITEKLSNSRNQLELQVNTWKRRLAPENAIFRVTSFQDQL